MAFLSLASALPFLESHGYTLLFILLCIEGPLVTYAAAFAASLGHFNIYAVFALAVLGCSLGDIPFYFLGRWSRKRQLTRYVRWFGIDHKTMQRIERGYHEHTGKTLTIVKIVPGIPVPGVILAGASGVPFWKFLFYSVLIAIPYALAFVLLGYYSGITYSALTQYFKVGQMLILGFVVVALLAWLFARWISARLGKRIGPA